MDMFFFGQGGEFDQIQIYTLCIFSSKFRVMEIRFWVYLKVKGEVVIVLVQGFGLELLFFQMLVVRQSYKMCFDLIFLWI